MQIACIGECMVEVAGLVDRPGEARTGFGGDTLNTAIYLARLLRADGHDVYYVSRLGDDPYSDEMIRAWRAEGVHCQFVEQVAGREAGLYVIDVDANGERNFSYWRSQAPARELFEGAAGAALIERLSTFDGIYFSGISLAILLPESRKRLLLLAEKMKAQGRMVAYDTNFRARLWNDSDARAVNLKALRATTLALPSAEDLHAIFGPQEEGWEKFLAEFSIQEIVLKHGGAKLNIYEEGTWQQLTLDKVARPVDTTAAGDSFNAGYLAARFQGRAPDTSADKAHCLARAVINFPGAIIPERAMPEPLPPQHPASREASA